MNGLTVFLQATPTEQAWDNLTSLVDQFIVRSPYIMVGLLVLSFFWLLAKLGRMLIWELGDRTRLDAVLLKVLGSVASVFVMLLGLLIAAVVIFPSFRPVDLVAGLGITSVAIGFALKDVLQNMFAGLLILWRKPFEVGDQIKSQEYEGTVEEINIRSTFIKTYDGERVVIPNSDIYSSPVLVRTAFGIRRIRLTVGIGYLDSIEQARAVIHRVLESTPGVLSNPGPWVYVSDLAPSSVNLEIFFWTQAEQANVLKVRNQVATAIKLATDEAGLDIAYPHQVVLFHNATGTRPGDVPLPVKSNPEKP